MSVRDRGLTPADLPAEPGEEWRDVTSHQGLYAVSSHGRVARLVRTNRSQPGDILRGHVNKVHGYRVMQLREPSAVVPVHQLVWRAFRGDAPTGLRISHRDDDRTNDRLDNLYVRSYSQQTTALYAEDRGPRLRGTDNPNGKLSDEQVREIAATAAREPARVTAARMGVAKSTVDKIRQGRYHRQPLAQRPDA